MLALVMLMVSLIDVGVHVDGVVVNDVDVDVGAGNVMVMLVLELKLV